MADRSYKEVIAGLDLGELIRIGTLDSDGVRYSWEGATIDQVGEWVPNRPMMRAMPPPFWEALKTEFRLFLCTRDSRYDGLRKHLAAAEERSQMTICSSIAAVMATYVGVAAGVLVPACALCLVALLKLGKEAFCASRARNIKVE